MVSVNWIRRVGLGVLLGGAWGCGAAHPYSYSRTYEPLDAEESLMEQADVVSYEDVRRDPSQHAQALLGWFGLVRDVQRDGDQVMVTLELRYHMGRHLCATAEESSCRVTVGARDGGPFSATLALHAEDVKGARRLAAGSLVKVYGYVRPNHFDDRGGPVLATRYYRHFPIGTYVIADGSTPERLRR